MLHNNAALEQAFMESKMAEQQMMHQHMAMESAWRQEHEAQMAQNWGQDFISNEVLNAKEGMMNQAFDQAKQKVEQQEQSGKEATGGLISMMMSDPDPKFKNSKFLDFLKRVHTGEYEIKDDNTMLHHPEKAGQADQITGDATMEAAFNQASTTESKTNASMSLV